MLPWARRSKGDLSMKKAPVFEAREFQNRVASVRKAMADGGHEALLVFRPEHLFYLTGYQTIAGRTFATLIVPETGSPTLLVRYLESFLVDLYTEGCRVQVYEDNEEPIAALAGALKALNLAGGSLLVEDSAPSMTYRNRTKLGELLPTARLTDGSGIVERLRRIKSPAEIEYMTKAAELTLIGMRAGLAECREGRTDNDIAAAAMDRMTRAGSEHLPLDPLICAGTRAGIPHTNYERRRLAKGDAILLELTGCYHRYVGPLMHWATIGRPAPEIAKAAQVCRRVLDAVVDAIRPGISAEGVDAVARGVLEKSGFSALRKRTGYCVGFAFAGGWNEGHIISLVQGDRTVLEPGMAFHMPISWRDYGQWGVGVSSTVVVTSSGARVLTRFDDDAA
jgi:Xaa-Pro dipeptidase